ncbi:unnamed protein product [Eretmochelys imbricata]
MNETLLQRLLCAGGPGNASGWNRSLCDPLRSPADLDFFTVRVLLYSLIFLLSVFGNSLIVVVLALNRRLRTVTNCFLLSLALSDLLLALCCMPFTLLPNLMGTFVFGTRRLQAHGLSHEACPSASPPSAWWRSPLSGTSAICKPLQSRVWQTRSHAYRVIAGTWLLSLLLMLPYAIYSTTVPYARPARPRPVPAPLAQPALHTGLTYILLLLILFFIPGVVMAVAYGLISRELYRSIRFETDIRREATGESAARCRGHGAAEPLAPGLEDDGCYVQLARPGGVLELSSLGRAGAGGAQEDGARVNSSQAKLLAKKRVIRMLIVIVVMFFLCWLPVFSANTWRAFAPASAQRALSGTPISFIHLLSYTSACANPLIYCFMNRRFRTASAATLARCRPRRPRRPPPDGEVHATGTSLSKTSYTTVSSLGPP